MNDVTKIWNIDSLNRQVVFRIEDLGGKNFTPKFYFYSEKSKWIPTMSCFGFYFIVFDKQFILFTRPDYRPDFLRASLLNHKPI